MTLHDMTNGHIAITEIFSSIQGESSLVGIPTVFIRTAGCNLRCQWCDTPHAFEPGQPYSVEALVGVVEDFGYRHVCITGGEPLLQENIHALMGQLCDRGSIVSLETGGNVAIASIDPRVHVVLDIKCPGSGMADRNLWDNLDNLLPHHEVKFVILDHDDYEYAKEICYSHDLFEKVKTVLFSPVFGELAPAQLVDWILDDNLPARLNLQIHKFIWSPEARGV